MQGSEADSVMMNKAWRTSWSGMEGIVAAPTRELAKYFTLSSGREADWDGSYIEIRAVRAQRWDEWAKGVGTGSHGGFRERGVYREDILEGRELAETEECSCDGLRPQPCGLPLSVYRLKGET